MKEKPEEIIEIKKNKEDIEYENAMMSNEFDLDRIIIAEEGVKTEEEIEEEIAKADIKTAKEEEPEMIEVKRSKKRKRKHVTCTIRSNRNIYRKAYSETQLLDVLGFNFKDGESYHCISAGDVDILSYLKCVLR